MIENM